MHRTKIALGIEFLIFSIIGIVAIILKPNVLWIVLRLALGLLLVLWGLVKCSYFAQQQNLHQNGRGLTLIFGIAYLIEGVLLIIFQKQNVIDQIICFSVGGLIILISIWRFLRSKQKNLQFFRDVYQYLVGSLIILLPFEHFSNIVAIIFFSIIGCLGLYFLIKYAKFSKIENKEIKGASTDVRD